MLHNIQYHNDKEIFKVKSGCQFCTNVAFILPDEDVLAGSLHFQQVVELLFVDLQIGDADREVIEVIFIQQLENICNSPGDDTLLLISKGTYKHN